MSERSVNTRRLWYVEKTYFWIVGMGFLLRYVKKTTNNRSPWFIFIILPTCFTWDSNGYYQSQNSRYFEIRRPRVGLWPTASPGVDTRCRSNLNNRLVTTNTCWVKFSGRRFYVALVCSWGDVTPIPRGSLCSGSSMTVNWADRWRTYRLFNMNTEFLSLDFWSPWEIYPGSLCVVPTYTERGWGIWKIKKSKRLCIGCMRGDWCFVRDGLCSPHSSPPT